LGREGERPIGCWELWEGQARFSWRESGEGEGWFSRWKLWGRKCLGSGSGHGAARSSWLWLTGLNRIIPGAFKRLLRGENRVRQIGKA